MKVILPNSLSKKTCEIFFSNSNNSDNVRQCIIVTSLFGLEYRALGELY